jgi:hypothetical protein
MGPVRALDLLAAVRAGDGATLALCPSGGLHAAVEKRTCGSATSFNPRVTTAIARRSDYRTWRPVAAVQQPRREPSVGGSPQDPLGDFAIVSIRPCVGGSALSDPRVCGCVGIQDSRSRSGRPPGLRPGESSASASLGTCGRVPIVKRRRPESSFAIARGQLFRALARHRKRRSRHGFRRYSASWREFGPDPKESQWRP